MPIPIRFGGYQPARSVHSRAVRCFGEALTQRIGAGVDFRFTENVTAVGRKAADLLAMVARALEEVMGAFLDKRPPVFKGR